MPQAKGQLVGRNYFVVGTSEIDSAVMQDSFQFPKYFQR